MRDLGVIGSKWSLEPLASSRHEEQAAKLTHFFFPTSQLNIFSFSNVLFSPNDTIWFLAAPFGATNCVIQHVSHLQYYSPRLVNRLWFNYPIFMITTSIFTHYPALSSLLRRGSAHQYTTKDLHIGCQFSFFFTLSFCFTCLGVYLQNKPLAQFHRLFKACWGQTRLHRQFVAYINAHRHTYWCWLGVLWKSQQMIEKAIS